MQVCVINVNVTVVSTWTNSSQLSSDPRLNGQELLQQWLAKHPEIVRRVAVKLQPEKRTIEQAQLSKIKQPGVMKKGYISITGMKYPPEVAQELTNVTDLPPSLLCIS